MRTQEYKGACRRLASSLTGRWSEGTAISSAGSRPPPGASSRAARNDLTHVLRGQAAPQLPWRLARLHSWGPAQLVAMLAVQPHADCHWGGVCL